MYTPNNQLFLYHVSSGTYVEHYILMNHNNLCLKDIPHNLYGYNPNGASCIMPEEGKVIWSHGIKRFYETLAYCQAYNLSEEDKFFFTMTYGDKLPHHTDNLHPLHNPILNMSVHKYL